MCERIANGELLLKISSEPAMPSRSTMHRWCRDNPEFREEYQIAVQLRADGLLEETIDIIDDKKEIVTETITKDEDGTRRVSKTFSKEGLAYALARINIRYKTLAKMAPRKWGDEGHGLGEPAPAPEPPRNGDDARNVARSAPAQGTDHGVAAPRRCARRRRKHEARHRSGFSRCLPVRPLCPSRDGGAASKWRLMRCVSRND